jgi:energy-coupling factor transporter transmembrane protein EcfT
VKSINPTCKFFGILLPAIALAIFYVPELSFFVLAACLVLAVLSRIPAKNILAVMLPAAILATGMFFTAYHFSSDTVIGAHRELFSDAGVYNGLILSGRLLAFSGLGMLFLLTTDKIDFIRSLNIQLRVPAKFAYGIIAAWGMFPKMVQEYVKTRAAFRARGLNAGWISPSLLLPLLVKSVRWSEAIAVAMESKGFGETGRRTQYYIVRVGAKDILFPILTTLAVMLGGILLGR